MNTMGLQEAEYPQEVPTAPHLSILSEEARNHAALDKQTPDIACFRNADTQKSDAL
jgi:hypothetical protein